MNLLLISEPPSVSYFAYCNDKIHDNSRKEGFIWGHTVGIEFFLSREGLVGGAEGSWSCFVSDRRAGEQLAFSVFLSLGP